MGVDPFAKVSATDRLPGFPARFYNDLQTMLAWWKSSQENLFAGTGRQALSERGIVIPTKNETGLDIPRFSILAISDFLITPDARLQEFKNRPTVKGTLPAADGALGRFVITQEPLSAGAVGDGLIVGVSAVQLEVIDATDDFAEMFGNDHTKLYSQPFGSAQILCKQAGTGTKWAYVNHGMLGMQLVLGKTNQAIDKTTGPTNAVDVYRGTTPGGEANTGTIRLTAWNHFGDVASGKWVLLAYLQRAWRIICAECP